MYETETSYSDLYQQMSKIQSKFSVALVTPYGHQSSPFLVFVVGKRFSLTECFSCQNNCAQTSNAGMQWHYHKNIAVCYSLRWFAFLNCHYKKHLSACILVKAHKGTEDPFFFFCFFCRLCLLLLFLFFLMSHCMLLNHTFITEYTGGFEWKLSTGLRLGRCTRL